MLSLKRNPTVLLSSLGAEFVPEAEIGVGVNQA